LTPRFRETYKTKQDPSDFAFLMLRARKSAISCLKTGTFAFLLCLIKWSAKAGFAGPEEYLRKHLTANELD
jgi:hypothetical protein